MKINQNRPDTQKVPVNTINTMMEQISDLQTDVAGLQNEVDGLGQSIDTVNIEATQAQITDVNATDISSTNATINNITASVGVNTANLDANTADIDTATIGTETVGTSTITDATIATANITDLDAVNGAVQHLSTDSIEANSLDVDAITTKGITNSGNYTGKNVTVENVTASDTINAKNLNVSDTVSVADINITGQVTGLSDIEASSITVDEIKADTAEIQSIENHSIYTDTLHPLVPSPSLVSDSDRYTIELPTFAGTMVLTWKEGNLIKWTATVIGNGVDYGITFGCTEGQVYINELFQWNKKLYIRHSANGQLLYSYNAEKELDPITIYYNMVGWTNPKSLEELCNEYYKYDVVRPSGTLFFGATKLMMQDRSGEDTFGLTYKGSTTVAGLPSFSEVQPGDVWNITAEGRTTANFIEGAGKPVNAGDDVIAVETETSEVSELEDFEPEFFGDKYIYDIGQTKTSDGDYLVVADETDYGGSSTNLYKGKNGNWTLLLEDCGAAIVTHTGRIIVEKTYDAPSLAYSDDNGETWTDLPYEYRAEYGWGSFVEFGSRIWYFTAYGATYRSDDNGTTFTNESLPKNGVVQIRENVLITSYRDNPTRPVVQIKKSIDNGETWTTVSSMHGSFNGLAALNGYVFAAVTSGILRSSDEGVTWDEVSALQGKLYAIDNKLFVLRDNDIYVTKDNGATFEEFIEINVPEQIIKSYNEYIIRSNVGWGPGNIYYCIDGARKVLKWDKFAAGVDYDNFVATNITATEDLTVVGDTALADTTVTGSLKKNNSEVLTEADKTNAITENSTDVITSGAVYAGMATKVDKTTTVNGHPLSSNVTVTKADVGLGNVDNTSDLDKPISTATQTALNTKINLTEKGVSNGVATLDATGRVPYNQLPESAMEYQGTWDASTNTPTLADGTGTNGDFYVVSAGGTVNFGTAASPRNVTFYVNDRVIYDGNTSQWARLPAGEVRSVNGMSGDVTLTASDVGAATGTDITNAINALDVSSVGGAGKYISAISETNGKISATATTMDTTPTVNSTNAVTSGGVKTAIDNEATARDTAITNAINALDVTDTAVSGKYVSAVSETDGIISVTRADLPNPNTTNCAKSLCGYVTCSTAGNVAAKTVDLPGFVLTECVRLVVNFDEFNTATSDVTLNVNNTGAYAIEYNGSPISSTNSSFQGYVNCYFNGYIWKLTSSSYDAYTANNATCATYTYGNAYCSSGPNVSAKVANMYNYVLAAGSTFPITFRVTNGRADKITLNINNTGAKDIWINGAVTSSTNYTLPAGTYMCFYDGTNYYIDTEHCVPDARTLQGMTPTAAISNNTIGMRNAEGNLFANNINMRQSQTFYWDQGVSSGGVYYCYNDWNTVYFSISVDVYLQNSIGYVSVGVPSTPAHWNIGIEYAPLNISFKPSSAATQLGFRHLSAIYSAHGGGICINYNTNGPSGQYTFIISGMLPMLYY